MQVIGAKLITGDEVLACVEDIPLEESMIVHSTNQPSTTSVRSFTRVRSVHFGTDAQGRQGMKLIPFVALQPDYEFDQAEWDSMIIVNFLVPEELEKIYLQAVSGIALPN